MRQILFAAVAFISLTGVAFAEGEGNGEPFPGVDAAVTSPMGNNMTARMQDPYHYSAPAASTQVGANRYVSTRMQDPYHFSVPDRTVSLNGRNDPSEAIASPGMPGSVAMGLAAPNTHG